MNFQEINFAETTQFVQLAKFGLSSMHSLNSFGITLSLIRIKEVKLVQLTKPRSILGGGIVYIRHPLRTSNAECISLILST